MKSDDLISRSALLERLQGVLDMVKEEPNQTYANAIRLAMGDVKLAHAVDAEPVIRCKDCEEYIPWGDGKICGLVGSYFGNTKPNDFCSRGKKMDGDANV